MAETGTSKAAATATDQSRTEVTFKVPVLRSRKTGQVLFLVAGKDFVDTLFSFLLLPVSTIIHMLAGAGGQEKGLGGISSIFKSEEKVDSSFMRVDKKTLLQPRPAFAGTYGSIGLLQGVEASKMLMRPTLEDKLQFPAVYYRCNRNGCTYFSNTAGGTCPCLGHPLLIPTTKLRMNPTALQSLKANTIEQLVDASAEEPTSLSEGFVSENITYMVTDNLEIMPSSTTIRTINVLSSLTVADLANLESDDITVSTTQILQLLHSALTSNNCLNDVFGKK